MPTIKLAVINASTVLKDTDVNKALPALQAQVHNDFAPAWGVDADLVFVPMVLPRFHAHEVKLVSPWSRTAPDSLLRDLSDAG